MAALNTALMCDSAVECDLNIKSTKSLNITDCYTADAFGYFGWSQAAILAPTHV